MFKPDPRSAKLLTAFQGDTKVSPRSLSASKALYDKARGFKLVKTKNGFDEVIKMIDKPKLSHEIITNLDFRGERVLLPENFVKMAQLKDDKEYLIKAKKGYVIIKDSMLL